MPQEAGHTFLARLGKKRLRPGGVAATQWLLSKATITPDTKILEVACNMGTTMVEVGKKYGCHIVGLDLDTEALEKAKKNISKNHLEERLKVVKGSAFALPFPDASFDIIINEAMLTMLVGKQKNRALSEYFRVLKPGGLLLTQDVCLYEEDPQKQTAMRAQLSRIIHVGVEPLTVARWQQVVESQGFAVEESNGPMTLMSPEGMIQDEGIDGVVQIMFNAVKKENSKMFTEMFNYFRDEKDRMGYIALVCRKK